MPAKSKAQQRFFGMVDAYKKGDLEHASQSIKDAAESMTTKEIKKFAKTKHKGLPNHVKKAKKNESIAIDTNDILEMVIASVNRILAESIGDDIIDDPSAALDNNAMASPFDTPEYDDTTAGGQYKINSKSPYYIDEKGKQIPVDFIHSFHNDYAIVDNNGKHNYIDANGHLISPTWFERCGEFESGFGCVAKDGKRNYISGDGHLLLDIWVDRAGDFMGDKAPIIMNGERHSVDLNGNII